MDLRQFLRFRQLLMNVAEGLATTTVKISTKVE
jgi:hypothetical protein